MISRLFAYNNGPAITGCSQSGNLAISNSGAGTVSWWNGPNESLGYIIAYTDTSGNRTSRLGPVPNGVGFRRTSAFDDSEFLTLTNNITGQSFLTASVATNWLNTNGYYTSYGTFAYKASITIDHTKVSSTDQSNFPVLVYGVYSGGSNTPDLRSIGNGGKVANSSGYDIYFYSDSSLTTRLCAERELYAASSGTIIYWIKVPTLSCTSDTVIYIAYGSGSITTDPNTDVTYGSSNVWTSNYQGVWHMSEATGNNALDSSGNNNTAVPTHSPTQSSAKIGNGLGFDGFSDRLTATNNIPALLTTDNYTWSTWVHVRGPASSISTIIGNRYDGVASPLQFIKLTPTAFEYYIGAANGTITRSITRDQWSYISIVKSGNRFFYYSNGASVSTSTTTSNMDTNPFYFGAGGSASQEACSCIIDEVHIANTNRSADWVATEYNNQNSPSTFYTIGSETLIPT